MQLARFVHTMRGYLPLPGEVGAVVGGPPCQGVSGLNRHGLLENIICDARCCLACCLGPMRTLPSS